MFKIIIDGVIISSSVITSKCAGDLGSNLGDCWIIHSGCTEIYGGGDIHILGFELH